MALQGTLDTFALPDVLRLLAATKKSGRLRLTGPQGSGDVWVTGGGVCAIEASHAPHAAEPVDALFELLRFHEGSFAFEADVAHDAPGPDLDVEALLEQAEGLLADWKQIEAVVPSLDAYVTLRRALAAPTVTLTQDHWTTLSAVGAGATVRTIGDALTLPEIPVSRAVRDLAELGVIEIEAVAPARMADVPDVGATASLPPRPQKAERAAVLPPPPVVNLDPEPDPEPEPAVVPEPESAAYEPQLDAEPESLPTARPLRARRPKAAKVEDAPDEPERFVPIDLPGHLASPAAPAEAFDAEPDTFEVDVDDDLAAAFPGLANHPAEPSAEDAELARQLAMLSPRAADAVRAAAEAETDEERDAAIDEATRDGDGTINRGLLLKFLSSVKS